MQKRVEQQAQIQSSNGWQNIGIMFKYARENIPAKYQSTFMFICDESFGYCQSKTLHRSNEFWMELLGIAKTTFLRHIKYLSENNHIEVVHKKEFVKGGGSSAYAYAPIYPKGIGKISLKSKVKKIEKNKKEIGAKF